MRTLILSFVLLAVPAAASAQVCPYGLVAVDAAHCCWPGQTFAPERGTCAGVPQCPAGLAPYGETCVAAAAAQPQAQPAMPPPPPPPAAYQPGPQPMMQPGMQLQPQVFGYPVRFEARKQGHEFTVTVDRGLSCTTPCELTVPPGRHRVTVEGDARFHDDLNFPAAPSTVQVEKRGAIAALGKASLGVGIPALAGGLIAGLWGFVLYNTTTPSYYNARARADFQTLELAGFGVAVGGAVLLGVGAGVGFGLAGKNRVRFAENDSEAPPIQLLSLGAAPTKDGAVMGASFAF